MVISNANMQTLENGSLYIREVGRDDAGHYMVQAINGVGPGISLVVRLTVNGPYVPFDLVSLLLSVSHGSRPVIHAQYNSLPSVSHSRCLHILVRSP